MSQSDEVNGAKSETMKTASLPSLSLPGSNDGMATSPQNIWAALLVTTNELASWAKVVSAWYI